VNRDSVRVHMTRFEADGSARAAEDSVAVEEPLEIRVVTAQGVRTSIAVTMRTPGEDDELAAGFLFTEGLLRNAEDLAGIEYGGGTPESFRNVIDVRLADAVPFDPLRFTRNVYTSSSCGVCGKTSLDMVRTACPEPPRGSHKHALAFITALPDRLAQAQPAFARTGGLHACALFAPNGDLRAAREDVGRHNAMDKVVGHALLGNALPATDTIVVVSGRASFELVQKAALAGVPTLIAVGAPSSLAVGLAREFGMTLAGFTREGRCNVYTGESRIER